jgi:hypothetical protein
MSVARQSEMYAGTALLYTDVVVEFGRWIAISYGCHERHAS